MVKRFLDEWVNWKVIVLLVPLFATGLGFTYSRAEKAYDCAQSVKEIVAEKYVPKDQYRVDMENINRKLDYIIEMHIEDQKR